MSTKKKKRNTGNTKQDALVLDLKSIREYMSKENVTQCFKVTQEFVIDIRKRTDVERKENYF